MELFGWFVVGTFASIVTTIVTEIVLNVKNIQTRPSTLISRIATFYYECWLNMFYLLVTLADVLSFMKTIALWIQRMFLRWIPREAILKSFRDLRKATEELFKAPFGAFVGFYDGIMASTYPLLTLTLFVVGSFSAVALIEVVLYMHKWEARPSTFMLATALSIYDMGFGIGRGLLHLRSVKAFAIAVSSWFFSTFFGWVPTEDIEASAQNLSTSSWAIVDSLRGVYDGFVYLFTALGLSKDAVDGSVFIACSVLGMSVCFALAVAVHSIMNMLEKRAVAAAPAKAGGVDQGDRNRVDEPRRGRRRVDE